MIEGYGIDVDYDGQALKVHGRNKPARIALAGADHEGDVVIPTADIAHVDFRDANLAVNGNLTVHTRGGRKYQLHFRRKQREVFAALAAQLRSVVA